MAGIPRGISELGDLSEAEWKVLRELDAGETVTLGDGERPGRSEDARRIRAELIRILLLGDDRGRRLGESGLRIRGAWVTGVLSLEGCRDLPGLALRNCVFGAMPTLRLAEMSALNLTGSRMPGLDADRLETRGSVYLEDVEADGTIRLQGATLGGNLNCDGAILTATAVGVGDRWKSDEGRALRADRVRIGGSISLRKVAVSGTVRLQGAVIAGNLSCDEATFHVVRGPDADQPLSIDAERLETGGDVRLDDCRINAAVSLRSARIGNNLDCRWNPVFDGGAIDLDLRGARIGGVFYLPATERPGGELVLSGAYARVVDGGRRALGSPVKTWLNRFEYDGLVGDAVNVPAEDWLSFVAKQFRPGDPADFYPQPYEQLAAVLRKAGHGEDARAVLIEKERRQRAARRAREGFAGKIWFGFWDRLLGVTVRYGRQPLWAFYWLLCFWLVGVGVFGVAEARGALKPNKEVVLRSDEWVGCAAEGEEAQAECYLLTDRGASYPRFNRWIYSADTLLPIVSLEMQEYWIPDDRKEWPGWGARGYLWFHIAVGWALSLLAVAGFSGLVKSE